MFLPPVRTGGLATVLVAVALAACELLPGDIPTTVPTQAAPIPLPLEPAPTPIPGVITRENSGQLHLVGLIQDELAGDLSWDAGGDRLALNKLSGAATYSLATLQESTSLDTEVTPSSLTFSLWPDDDFIATAGQDLPESHTVSIWNARNGSLHSAMEGHADWINSVRFSPVSDLVVSGSDDWTVRFWDASIGTESMTLQGHTGPVSSVTFSPDGQLAASVSLDGTARIWRVIDGRELRSLKSPGSGLVSVAFSPDGYTIAAGDNRGGIALWAAGTETLLLKLGGHAGSVTGLDFSSKGDLLASSGRDGTVRLWETSNGGQLGELSEHAGQVISVEFSPDGKLLASGSLDGTVQLWGIGDPGPLPPPPSESEPVQTPLAEKEPVQYRESDGVVETIRMVSESDGWAIGGFELGDRRLLTTRDGGANWIEVDPRGSQESADESLAGYFLDGRRAWVLAYPTDLRGAPSEAKVLRTDSGGERWSEGALGVPIEVNERPPELVFVDPETGWLLVESFAGAGQHAFSLFSTRDGGTGWTTLHAPPESLSDCHSTGMDFADRAYGWITETCSAGVFVERTDDGGESFVSLSLPPPANDPTLFERASSCGSAAPSLFTSDAGALLVECENPTRTMLYVTEDAGETWEDRPYPGGALQFVDSEVGWALSNQIRKTEDVGRTWDLIRSVGWDGQFSFISADLGWAVARGNGDLALVMTSDGAAKWKLIEPRVALVTSE